MAYSDSEDARDDDFYRWFVGGSPPETDGWPRDAFANTLGYRDPVAAHHGASTAPSAAV